MVDKQGRLFLWGENSQNLRIRKPKLFATFPPGVKQVEFGRRHGLALDKAG